MKVAVILAMLAIVFGVSVNGVTQVPPGIPDLPEEALEDLEEAKDLMGEGGPEVGEMAPDFTLQGVDGIETTLSSLRGKIPAVLIFGSCT